MVALVVVEVIVWRVMKMSSREEGGERGTGVRGDLGVPEEPRTRLRLTPELGTFLTFEGWTGVPGHRQSKNYWSKVSVDRARVGNPGRVFRGRIKSGSKRRPWGMDSETVGGT